MSERGDAVDYEREMGLLLSKYMDNEVTPEERKLVEDHLLQCRSCSDLLAVFRRNEQLLSSALGAEVFGNQIVERVMAKVDPKPRVLSIPTLAQRRWLLGIAAGAAAAVLLAVVTIQALNATRYANLLAEQQARIESLAMRAEELDREISRQRAEAQLKENMAQLRDTLQEKSLPILAMVEGGRVFLCGRFDDPTLVSYNVYRRLDGQKEWSGPINREPLKRPEFVDRPSADGTYQYEIRATRKDGTHVAAPVVTVKLQGSSAGADPGKSLKIVCLDASEQSARFELRRVVGGRERSALFEVQVGQVVGGKRFDPTLGEMIEFTSDYTLEQIVKDVQIARVGELDVAVRENFKLTLRRAGAARGPQSVTLWRGESVNLPCPK